MFVEPVGDDGLPLVVLHGGPGLDHTHLRPWLDPLGEEFRVFYVDERGQGQSERVDPATLSLEAFARDVDLLAEALELDRFALLGHSFGAIITTWHAINLGTAAGYVISGGGDSSAALMADVEASLEAMGEAGKPIAESWEWEQTVETLGGLRGADACPEPVSLPRPAATRLRGGHRVFARGAPPLRQRRVTATSTTRPTSAGSPRRPSFSSASTTGRRRRAPPASSTRAFPAASTRSCRTRAT